MKDFYIFLILNVTFVIAAWPRSPKSSIVQTNKWFEETTHFTFKDQLHLFFETESNFGHLKACLQWLWRAVALSGWKWAASYVH